VGDHETCCVGGDDDDDVERGRSSGRTSSEHNYLAIVQF